jgi:PhnB protein
MGARLNPYLAFDGTAREAMTFYQQIFGGDLTVSTFGEFGDPGMPGADGVMHAQLETPSGLVLMASDTPPGQDHDTTYAGGMTASISGDDVAIRQYWEGLAEGGQVMMPFEKQMWGDEFGMLTDKYGVPWMLNLTGQPSADD